MKKKNPIAELTDSCYGRTLVVDIFRADKTNGLGGHSLKINKKTNVF